MPPSSEKFVGVHVDRTGGTLLTATLQRPREGNSRLTVENQPVEITWQSHETIKEEFEAFAQKVAKLGGPNLKAIGVASPGPFQSLRRSHIAATTFGYIDPKYAHRPLNGIRVYDTFKAALKNSSLCVNAEVIIHTDAMACAIGEAVFRNVSSNHLLAFFIVGDGIGLGLVRGTSPLRSALHPEVGLLGVQLHKKERHGYGIDILTGGVGPYSVAQVASNIALRKRCGSLDPDFQKVFNLLGNTEQKVVLNLRAYYLAQMCLACTVMLPPHKIVLGEHFALEQDDDLAKRVHRYFRSFMKSRDIAGQPIFGYPELYESSFISNQLNIMDPPCQSKIGRAGAMGMLYAAARADLSNNKVVVDMA